MKPTAVIFLMSLGFWFVFSGELDALHVGFGVVSAALVTFLTRDLAWIGTRLDRTGRPVPVYTFSIRWGHFLAYLPWLLWQIVLANLQIAWVIMHPRLPIAPALVRFRTTLVGDVARTTLGNSITLTPGTITVDVEGDEFVVHALTREAARGVLGRAMEKRVARAVGPA